MDENEALELGQEALDIIDDLPDAAWDKAASFFESVSEKIKGIMGTIESSHRVSERQAAALQNMRDSVARWQHDED